MTYTLDLEGKSIIHLEEICTSNSSPLLLQLRQRAQEYNLYTPKLFAIILE